MKLRSLLYVPAHNEKFVAKAHERGADAIILDLEDSVPAASKAAAREALKEAVPSVARNGATVFVRINSGWMEAAREDVEAACRAGAFGLILPKARDVPAITTIADFATPVERRVVRPTMAFIALIEDAGAVLNAQAIARLPRVLGLALGSEDFAAAVGAVPTPEILRFPALLVHYAAKAEGKLSLGLMQSIADYSDTDAIAAAARMAHDHGFDGATCVHPSAVAVLNEAFSPSAAELDWARRVVAADDGSGVVVVDGRMVDAPVVERARRVLGE